MFFPVRVKVTFITVKLESTLLTSTVWIAVILTLIKTVNGIRIILCTEQNRTELYFALHPRPHAGGIKE